MYGTVYILLYGTVYMLLYGTVYMLCMVEYICYCMVQYICYVWYSIYAIVWYSIYVMHGTVYMLCMVQYICSFLSFHTKKKYRKWFNNQIILMNTHINILKICGKLSRKSFYRFLSGIWLYQFLIIAYLFTLIAQSYHYSLFNLHSMSVWVFICGTLF